MENIMEFSQKLKNKTTIWPRNSTSGHRFIYNGMEYYSVKMEYCLAIKRRKSCHCDNLGGPWGHYAKWDKPDRLKTNTLWSHLYLEFKTN